MIETLNKHPMYLFLYEIDKNKDENKKINNNVCDFFGIDKTKFFLYKKTENKFFFNEIAFKKNKRFNFFEISKDFSNHVTFISEEHLIEPTLNKEERYLTDSESVFYDFYDLFKIYGEVYSKGKNIVLLNKINSSISKFEMNDFGSPKNFIEIIKNTNMDNETKNYIIKMINEISLYKNNTQTYYQKTYSFDSNTALNNLFKEELFNA